MATRRRNMTRRKGRVVKRRTMRRMSRRAKRGGGSHCPKCGNNDKIKVIGHQQGMGICRCECGWEGPCHTKTGTSIVVAASNSRTHDK